MIDLNADELERLAKDWVECCDDGLVEEWFECCEDIHLPLLRARDAILAQAQRIAVLEAELAWLQNFADVRSKDESKVFARVNRGALRTIRDRAVDALARETEA